MPFRYAPVFVKGGVKVDHCGGAKIELQACHFLYLACGLVRLRSDSVSECGQVSSYVENGAEQCLRHHA